MSSSESIVKIDPTTKSIGDFGRYQLMITILIYLCKVPIGFIQLSMVILGPVPDFECIDKSVDKCSPNCTEHVFNKSVFSNTVIMEFDLVCERHHIFDVSQSLVMFGILIGNLVFGWWSDRFGRRTPLLVGVVLQLVTGIGCAFVPDFTTFAFVRFVAAVAIGGTMCTSYVILAEVVGTSWRSLICVLYQVPFFVGHSLLALIAYVFRDWRQMQLAMNLPFLVLLVYFCFLPESSRWCLNRGKKEQAIEILTKGAKMNNMPTDKIPEYVNAYQSSDKKPGNILDLFSTKRMTIKTLCMSYQWIICGFCFYGVSQYIGYISENLFITVSLSCVSEIPATVACAYLVNSIGRKLTMILVNLICGFCFFLIPFVPTGLQISLALIALGGMAMAFSAVYVYAGEIFPTVVRNVGVGVASTLCRIGSMLAPILTGLGKKMEMLPPIMYAVICLLGVFLCIPLPETNNKPLPETLEDADEQ